MPKDPWTYKRRKRRSRGKVLQDNFIECSQLSDPVKTSTSIEPISEMPLNNPVKNEDPQEIFSYPDTRFPQSTTLFPAEVERNSHQSVNLRETVKRISENKLFSNSKKVKVIDSSEENFSDDCIIIEPSPKKVRVKIEVVDLTDDSKSIFPIVCSPIRSNFLQDRKPNITLSSNSNDHVNVESVTCEVDTEADMNFATQEKSKENNSSKYTANANTSLSSELNVEKRDNRRVGDRAPVTNTGSVSGEGNATHARISDNGPMKLEESENCDNSTLISKYSTDVNRIGLHYDDFSVKKEVNETETTSEISANNVVVHCSPVNFRTETPPEIPFVAESLSNAVDNHQTKEKVKNWLASCMVNNEELHENVLCDKNKTDEDLPHIIPLPTAPVKKESEVMDYQEISRNCSKIQHCDNMSQKSTITNTSRNFSVDSQLGEANTFLNTKEIFDTPFLRYFNLNTKVSLLELSEAISYLTHMIEVEENVIDNDQSTFLPKTGTGEKVIGDNLWNERSNNQSIEKRKNHIKELPTNDFLRQILNKAKPI